MEEVKKIFKNIKLYFTSQTLNMIDIFQSIWYLFCQKFKIFRFKVLSLLEAEDYLRPKLKELELKTRRVLLHSTELERKTQFVEFFVMVGEYKLGDVLRYDKITQHNLDKIYDIIMRLYLSEVCNVKYKHNLDNKTKKVKNGSNIIFQVNKIQCKNGTYDINAMKDSDGNYKVVGYEEIKLCS
jgi:hypothetical protein